MSARQVQLPRSRRGRGQAGRARRYLSERTERRPTPRTRRQMDSVPSCRC